MATAVRPQPVQVQKPQEKTGGMDGSPAGIPAGENVNSSAQHSPVGTNNVDPNSPRSPGVRNAKAEAMLDAHKQRVESECNVYLGSETRKAEARAATAQSKLEQKRMKDEARAIEHKKREEAKADQVVQNAEIKAAKVMQNAKEEAMRMKAHANEECERLIADAHSQAERERAALEQSKQNEISELTDRVESMKAAGEFPMVAKKGMIGRMKEKLPGHH